MSISRRKFIKTSLVAGAFIGSGFPVMAANRKTTRLTILHTNDVHSHIDPMPADHPRFPNQGGFARRAALIKQLKLDNPNTLVFDCGDIFQGTPYFNFFKGSLEIDLMNEMGYHAATIGNHEFDNGIEELAEQVKRAKFPFVCSNYNFDETPLQGLTKPYHIIETGGVRVGVIGLGIELSGLVDPSKYGATQYLDPLTAARHYSSFLKKDKKCDYVICLSHMGFQYKDAKVSDRVIARETSHIDMILGGHTHTFLEKPVEVINQTGKKVLINQTGWAGINLGRIDVTFEKGSKQAVGDSSIIYGV
jgi:5'-nucleotidase